MKGSEKQIKWAEDIKAEKAELFEILRQHVRNEIGTKALDYIQDNEYATFWIDHRNHTPMIMLKSLLTGRFEVKGASFDRKAQIDPDTGVITETWTEMVRDGDRGDVKYVKHSVTL